MQVGNGAASYLVLNVKIAQQDVRLQPLDCRLLIVPCAWRDNTKRLSGKPPA